LDPLLRSCLVPVSRGMLWPYILDTAVQREELDTPEKRTEVMFPHQVIDTVFLPTRRNVGGAGGSGLYAREKGLFQLYENKDNSFRRLSVVGSSSTYATYFLSTAANITLDGSKETQYVTTGGNVGSIVSEINDFRFCAPCFCV
ncbi:MAG: hypothetical protein IJJ33_04450, partial [Victivallales bacterium]|nr:hypothetical protein [Victivallales bacterium]